MGGEEDSQLEILADLQSNEHAKGPTHYAMPIKLNFVFDIVSFMRGKMALFRRKEEVQILVKTAL